MTRIASPPLAAAVERSPLVAAALEKARQAHAGQVRNGSGGMPYIEHPQAVAALLAEHGHDDEVLAAALLHDVVEDSDTTVEELRDQFGDRVADLVAALSDDESIDDYRARKDEHRERVRAADGDAFAIYGADKLTNVRTIRRAYNEEGERVRDEFKVPLELKLEVWEADRAMLEEEAPELPFLDELDLELNRLRADLEAAAPRRGT
ncbi:MAG TPA: HD domain-containing protein [Solirubrobacterales bacterium]|nr:HD domain-containing protein [Solirubrobacterales bacterium]